MTDREVRLIRISLIMYLAVLFWIIALKCNLEQAVTESIIFASRMDLGERFAFYMSKGIALSDIPDTVINVLIFMPLSMLLPFLIKKRPYILTVALCFFISCFFEILQILSTIGGFTYIDIINNTIGGALGALLHFCLVKHVQNRKIIKILRVVIWLLSLVIVFASINTIINIDIYFPN